MTVALGNDAHFALLAEAALGAARDVADAILVAIGTGHRLRGAGGRTDRARARRRGRIVRLGLRRSAGRGRRASADGSSATLRDPPSTRSPGAPDSPMHAHLIAAARAGDPPLAKGWRQPCAALGAALAGAVALLGSRSVIVAGGLAESVDVLGAADPAALSDAICRRTCVRSLLAPAHFGARASLVGAGLAALGHPLWTGPRP